MRIRKWAELSPDGIYRWTLGRELVGSAMPLAIFSLLNPSTADAEKEDATSRRLWNFAMALGYGGYVLVNMFGFRATSPSVLYDATDPVGPENKEWIFRVLQEERHRRQQLDGYENDVIPVQVICGWGNHGALMGQDQTFLGWMDSPELLDIELQCFGLTKQNQPKHPLYLPATARPREWTFLERMKSPEPSYRWDEGRG